MALAPTRKNGTSAPSATASGSRRSSGQSSRQSRLSASSVEAASELPPPRPAPQGTRLSIVMSAPSAVPDARLQRAGGAQAEVVGGQLGEAVVAGEPAVAAQLEVERVAPVDQHHQRMEQMHAVGALADDVQEQVQLGRRRDVVERADGHARDSKSDRAGCAP